MLSYPERIAGIIYATFDTRHPWSGKVRELRNRTHHPRCDALAYSLIMNLSLQLKILYLLTMAQSRNFRAGAKSGVTFGNTIFISLFISRPSNCTVARVPFSISSHTDAARTVKRCSKIQNPSPPASGRCKAYGYGIRDHALRLFDGLRCFGQVRQIL